MFNVEFHDSAKQYFFRLFNNLVLESDKENIVYVLRFGVASSNKLEGKRPFGLYYFLGKKRDDVEYLEIEVDGNTLYWDVSSIKRPIRIFRENIQRSTENRGSITRTYFKYTDKDSRQYEVYASTKSLYKKKEK